MNATLRFVIGLLWIVAVTVPLAVAVSPDSTGDVCAQAYVTC